MDAVDDLSDAIDVTRDFLTPVEFRRWLKLAVVVFFLTGLSFNPPTTPTGDTTPGTDPFAQDPFAETPVDGSLQTDQLVELAIVLAVIVLVLWLVFSLIGALMEFVLVESLRSGTVSIVPRIRTHLRKGLSLFAFTVGLGVIAVLLVAVPTVVLLYPIESIEQFSLAPVGGVVVLSAVVGLAYALVVRLTTEFVVPVMVLEDRGIRRGWGRFWRTLRSAPGEYVVYVVLATIVNVVAAIAISLLAMIALLVLAIPFVLLGLLALTAGPLAVPLVVSIAVVAVVTALLVMALFRMPVVVYVRYYALLVLGDTDPELDLIPDRREAVRTGTDWADDEGWTDRSDGRDGAGWRSGDTPGSGRGAPDDDRDDGDSGWRSESDDASDDGDDSTDWGYRDDS